MALIAKATPPSFEGTELRYRQVEARCYDWAKHNPGRSLYICFGNERSGFWGHVEVISTGNGKLSERTLSDLRGVKRNVDDGRDYDGFRCYSITICDGRAK
jgi:hypothetical protein